LILTNAVTRPTPVAVIAAVGSQSNRAGFRSFDMDGSGSYHLDANSSIIEYLWDWNAADGLDWNSPNATGPRPTNPGYATVGNYTVTLRVKDNQDPFETSTSTVVVNVIDTDIAPVAVAIPAARAPAYTGRVGQPIQLDGTASFDPENDAITDYSWDTDGNGTYGDATGPTPSVTFNTPHVGQIGLRVTANGKTSTNSAVADIYATQNDFYIESIAASNIVVGVSADVEVVVKNAVGSNGTWNNVSVRFYTGDPFANGVQIGGNYTVNLPPQGTATLNASLTNLNGLQVAYAYVDATRTVPEWDERNNTSSVNVATKPEIIVYNGSHTMAPELTDGQATVVNFGGTAPGVASVLTFLVRNTGDGDLHITSVTVPAGYITTGASTVLAPGTSYNFQVSLNSNAANTYTGNVVINSDDQNEAAFDFPVTGTVVPTGSAPVVNVGTGDVAIQGPPVPESWEVRWDPPSTTSLVPQP
jgi:hypothetical protein